MEVVPLGEGDLAWVFGAHAANPALSSVLTTAAERITATAAALDGRAGWSGSGLEFHRLPGSEPNTARTDLAGFVELADSATFSAEITPEAGGYEITAEITVRCDAPVDCGQHTVASWPTVHTAQPDVAAAALARGVDWLCAQAMTHPPGYWRSHDPRHHPR